jgi:hypothetical protein
MNKQLINRGFTEVEENVFTRAFSRMVDVAFYGKMESTFKVTVELTAHGAIIATYEKNGRVIKRKVHSFGEARAINAIQETLSYHGFSLAEEGQTCA